MVHSPFSTSDDKQEPEPSEPGEPGDYVVMFSSRRPSQQILVTRHLQDTEEEPIFHLEQMSFSPEEENRPGRDGLAGLTGRALHSHWSSSNEAWLSLVESNLMP